MPEISNEDLFEVTFLVYRRWEEESDLLKKVKAEIDDGSPDFAAFHELRLKNHTASEKKWHSLVRRLMSIAPKS